MRTYEIINIVKELIIFKRIRVIIDIDWVTDFLFSPCVEIKDYMW